ncbi:hypothetical protein [Streptomyces sp. SM13]|uniref:hypothetical protein n=1 Tax=Streptomyces sp. SM13 TaxID=1983803 RepID=UPI000CD57F2F|nr:hypothetical protein [Streptomyces sp. SM13]
MTVRFRNRERMLDRLDGWFVRDLDGASVADVSEDAWCCLKSLGVDAAMVDLSHLKRYCNPFESPDEGRTGA